MGFLPHVLILLSIYIYIYIYIYTSLSLYLSPLSLSLIYILLPLSYWFKKIKGPQPLLQIGWDRGAHRDSQFFCRWRYFPDSWGGYMPRTWIWCQLGYCSCFLASKVEDPMAGGEGVVAIGAEDLWRLVPSGGRFSGKILVLYYLLPRVFYILSRRRV